MPSRKFKLIFEESTHASGSFYYTVETHAWFHEDTIVVEHRVKQCPQGLDVRVRAFRCIELLGVATRQAAAAHDAVVAEMSAWAAQAGTVTTAAKKAGQ